jgi:SAM-dependent methyltransferase
MKYYEAHDEQYRKLLAQGQVAWDKGEYDEFSMRALIERFTRESNFEPTESNVLDLGCGTGGLACYLASRGFRVTAIDISATAILEAKKQAVLRGLKINFKVADLCHEQLPEKAFELIADNHFLHCIVFPDERHSALQNINHALKATGEYWLETMVGHPEMRPRDEWHLDAEGISWRAVSSSAKIERCIERNGQIWCPTRRIQPTDKIIMEELHRASFEIVWYETAPPMDENDTGTFRAKCQPKKTSI